jgi:hypothetical protein
VTPKTTILESVSTSRQKPQISYMQRANIQKKKVVLKYIISLYTWGNILRGGLLAGASCWHHNLNVTFCAFFVAIGLYQFACSFACFISERRLLSGICSNVVLRLCIHGSRANLFSVCLSKIFFLRKARIDISFRQRMFRCRERGSYRHIQARSP